MDMEKPKRRAVNLSIRADILNDAKAYNINASQEAEKALAAAVKKAKEQEWLEQNEEAIAAHNERVRKHGLLLKPHWMDDDE